ncbi:unnamed protein product [Echinostoma caproni]|uniref:Reverse transcriptase domain-containing protein n=1 Tax=Echinostoma caproni TaxID=27848 RepID=A0A183AJJ0_9TREM|nr:unnamed protein product [Echinostoma caproni]
MLFRHYLKEEGQRRFDALNLLEKPSIAEAVASFEKLWGLEQSVCAQRDIICLHYYNNGVAYSFMSSNHRSGSSTNGTNGTLGEVMKSLHGCQYFSKIDLADAYLQIPLDVESRYLTTINTPWGMYQYNFLPFGLHVSSGLFQSAGSVIKGLDGVLAYQDDVLIFGLNKKDYDARLMQLLERFATRNVAIKPSKCVFGVSKQVGLSEEKEFDSKVHTKLPHERLCVPGILLEQSGTQTAIELGVGKTVHRHTDHHHALENHE